MSARSHGSAVPVYGREIAVWYQTAIWFSYPGCPFLSKSQQLRERFEIRYLDPNATRTLSAQTRRQRKNMAPSARALEAQGAGLLGRWASSCVQHIAFFTEVQALHALATGKKK